MNTLKRLIRVCSISLIFLSIAGTAAAWDGTGTDTDPYQIRTWNDFDDLRTYTESGDPAAYFRLMNNLDFEDYGNIWLPIGSESKPFNSIFDGSSYIIYNFSLNSAADNAGFFGYIEEAHISGLNFENATVSGKNNVGVLAGKVSQTQIDEIGIYKCTVTASENNAGGIVGYASNPLTPIYYFNSCHVLDSMITAKNNAGGITGSSVNYGFYTGSFIRSEVMAEEISAGGILGSFEYTGDYYLYTYDFFVADSSVKSKNDAGGLIGTAHKIQINHPSVHSSVIYASGNNAGGIIGNASSVSIYGSRYTSVSDSSITAEENAGGIIGKGIGIYNTSYYWGSVDLMIESISVSSDIQAVNNSGGIIGYSDHVFVYASHFIPECNSSVDSKVTASGNYAGGIIGYAADFTNVSCSSSSASVSSQSGAGGIAGYLNNSTVYISYSAGNVAVNSSGSNAGGLVGVLNSSSIEDSYTISDVTGNVNSGGFIGLVESGSSNSEILRCYAANPKSGMNGFIGSDSGSNCDIDQSFYLEGGTAQPMTGLKELTETEMKSFATFDDEWNDAPSNYYIFDLISRTGWNWGNWIIVDQSCYPQLSWQNKFNDYVIEIGSNPDAVTGDPDAAEQLKLIGTGEIAKDRTGKDKWWSSQATYIIREDIDMIGVDFVPLYLHYGTILGDKGNGETPVISNLVIENYGSYAGLFGYTDGSFISNIRLHNITVNGAWDAGAFTGYSYNTTFSNCSVTSGQIEGFKVVGGLIGSSTGDTIDYCSFEGTIIGTNDLPAYGQITNISFIGGLAGIVSADSAYYKSSITNSEFKGEILVEFDSNNFNLSQWDEGFLVDNIGGLYGGSFLTADVMTLTIGSKPLDFIYTPFIDPNYYTFVEKPISVNEFDSEKLKDCLPLNVYVENCSVDADIQVRDLTSSELTYYSLFNIPGPKIGMIGGLTGSAVAAQIENCSVDADILVEGSFPDNKTLASVTGNVGGLNGITIFSVINDSSSTGSLTVYGSDSQYNVFTGAIGGLSGMTVLTAIENSFSDEDVTVYGGNNAYLNQYLSDLALPNLVSISYVLNQLLPPGIGDNFFNAYIESLSTGSVGGLTGLAFFGTVENCYAAGDVEVKGDGAAAIGGLIGLSALELVNDSFVSGDVSVTGSNSVGTGGMFGLFTLGEIEDCYVTGDVLLSDPLFYGMTEDDFTSAGAGGLIGIFLNDDQALGLFSSLGLNADIFLDTSVSDSHALNEYVTSSLSGRVIGLNFDVFSYGESLYFNKLFAWENMSNEFSEFGFGEFDSGFSENGTEISSEDVWNKSSWIQGSNWQLNNYENFLLPILSYQEKPFIAYAEHLIPDDDDPKENNSTGGGDGNATIVPPKVNSTSSSGNGTGGAKVIEPEPEAPAKSSGYEGDILQVTTAILRLSIFGIAVWCYRRYTESLEEDE